MPEQFGDKTHEATPHRRQQAREQGNVAKSVDLSSVVVLIGALLSLKYLGQPLVDFLGNLSRRTLGRPVIESVGPEFFLNQWYALAQQLSETLLPIFGVIALTAVGVNIAQVGFLLAPQKLVPDVKRLNPLQGIQRTFSIPNAVRLTLGVFKIAVVAAVGLLSVWTEHETVLGLAALELPQIVVFIIHMTIKTGLWIAMALLLLALMDLGFQRWKHEQDLRMTTQEVRDELKTIQGDPQVINRRRQVQRQLAANRLQTAVPDADVVITNPTHLAVAVKYDHDTMPAPIVIAKGAGVLAQRIRQLAIDNNIPVVERKPLAQALYKKVDVQQPIPSEQYAAVAEVLRFVYQLKGKKLPGRRPAA